MTRIIAGVAGGRSLRVPAGSGTRPTSDRAREGLFSTLGDLTGLRVLDLFAGSGAVGLEALSRGAAHATLVEADPRAVAVVRANVVTLGLPGAVVAAQRVERWLAAGVPMSGSGSEAFDVVFLDPPYADPVEAVLAAVVPWARGTVVVERASRDGAPPWPEGLVPLRSRRYGEGTLWYGFRS